MAWFARTFITSVFSLRGRLPTSRPRGIVVVHGDTVSTVMGAVLAKLNGWRVAHVEAGLRSFDFLHPFPEEIDRVIASRFVDFHFCPNAWAAGNLAKLRGEKIDTQQNTLLDALAIAQETPLESATLSALPAGRFFVFVMHRQENLYDAGLVRDLVDRVVAQSRSDPCVFILHHLTEAALAEQGHLDRLRATPGIRLVPRLPYVEFMKVLARATYVVTDGGSNQEECYYLGKPCLILRKVTERTEGLGENVLLSRLDPLAIEAFLAAPDAYRRAPVESRISPSEIIARRLAQALAS
jgi:UDP-N-acetylglucosamine 2-epimerase (non-hydrolysing)